MQEVAVRSTIEGLDLRLARVSRNLTMRAVAESYPCSPRWLRDVETDRQPTRRVVMRYLAALDRAASR